MKKMWFVLVVLLFSSAWSYGEITEGWYRAKINITQIWERDLISVEFKDDPDSDDWNVPENFWGGIYTADTGSNKVLAMCLTACSADLPVMVYVQPVGGFVKIVSISVMSK